MTITEDQLDEVTEDTDESTEDEDTEDESTDNTSEAPKKRGRVRDFTKSNEHYDSLTVFINENSGLAPVTPLQVKATLALKTDYANLPEQKAAREQKKAERAAEDAKYAGLTDEQKKAAKVADRAQKQYEKMAQKAKEALEKAQSLAAAAAGSGEDLAAIVNSAQETTAPESSDESETEDAPQRRGRGLGRGRNR